MEIRLKGQIQKDKLIVTEFRRQFLVYLAMLSIVHILYGWMTG
jgi:hypothetical protein